MSYRGDGYPVLVVDGTATSFPLPLKGTRDENLLEEESTVVTRRNGERVHLARRFRFKAEYEWGNLTTAQAEALILWRNSWPRVQVTVRPHHDVTTLQVACWLEELKVEPGTTGATIHRARAVFVGIEPFTGTMIPDESVVAGDYTDYTAHQ